MSDTPQAPAVDLNKLSTEDLLAIKSGDLNKVSTEGLLMLKAAQPPQPQAKPEIPAYQSAIVGGGKGVVDPALAIGQYVGGKPAEFSNEVLRRMKPFQEANPTAFGAGQLGGSFLTGAGEAKVIGSIPSFVKASPYLQGSVLGGMMGVLTPNEQGKSGLDALADVPLKAVEGAAGGAGSTALGRGVANVVAPKLSAAVQKLIGEGVNLTPGQMIGGMAQRIEDKMTSIPLLGDIIQSAKTKGIEEFNKAAYKQSIRTYWWKSAKRNR